MRMTDIISKKRDGQELTFEDIKFFIEGYVNNKIPDYQMSAMLMAIYFKGLSNNETFNLTSLMSTSGQTIDLSSIKGIKIDKHSTGGVGDKTTLIVVPIVASLGVKVAKMSGRGLGHTGGTIDKLESIPGLKTDISRSDFFNIVNTVGASIISQSENIVPADKKIYALRDATSTVNSVPLIASSIMSKKIASGSDCILLDVKVGSGAFMKNLDDAFSISSLMVKIGEKFNKKTIALITNMDQPLGNAIGNFLEVIEACETLKGKGPSDLEDICIEISANMLHLANLGDIDHCKKLAYKSLHDKTAFLKLKEIVKAQGGDVSYLDYPQNFIKDITPYKILSKQSGYIKSINTEKCGLASMILGAGRETKESSIDYKSGIILHKKVGDFVNLNDSIATFYSKNIDKYKTAENIFLESIELSPEKPSKSPLIYAQVSNNGIIEF